MRRLVRITLASGALLALTVAPTLVHAETPPPPPSQASETTPPTPPVSQPTSSSNSVESNDQTAKQKREEAKKKADEMKAKFKAIADAAKQKADKAKQEAKDRQADNHGTNPEDKAKKLEQTKLRICEKRQTSINRLMGNISGRGQKQLDMITTVSTRVQSYVATNNLTVTGYDSLVAAVVSSKTAAQAAIDATKEAQAAFRCDGSDPNGAADSFKTNLKAQNDSLKAYRDSVKELIKAVKAATPPTTPMTPGGDGLTPPTPTTTTTGGAN